MRPFLSWTPITWRQVQVVSWGVHVSSPRDILHLDIAQPDSPLASQSAQYLLSSSLSSLDRMVWCCSLSFCAFSLSERVVMSLLSRPQLRPAFGEASLHRRVPRFSQRTSDMSARPRDTFIPVARSVLAAGHMDARHHHHQPCCFQDCGNFQLRPPFLSVSWWLRPLLAKSVPQWNQFRYECYHSCTDHHSKRD